MKNKKIISAFASLALVAVALLSPTLAADEYLDDVENVVAVSVSGGVKLSWDPVTNADFYTIYYGTQSVSEDGASYEDSLAVENVTEYVVTDLLPQTIYYFAVAADDSSGLYFGSYNYSEEVTAIAGEEIIEEEDPIVEEEEIIPEDETPVEDETPIEDEITLEVDDETLVDETDPEFNENDFVPVEEVEEVKSASQTQTQSDPNLPDSGPATAAVALISSAGAYVYRKFKK